MKRGYAVSGMLYTILVLFMALLLSFLYTMQNKKNILDKLKTEVVEAFYCSKADNIEDLRGSTVVATSVTQEGDNALIQLPKEGRYDTTSYLSVPSEMLNNLVKFTNITMEDYTETSDDTVLNLTPNKYYLVASIRVRTTDSVPNIYSGADVIFEESVNHVYDSDGNYRVYVISFIKATSSNVVIYGANLSKAYRID